MKLNYYIIASLPDLSWDGEIKDTSKQFLEDNEHLLEPYGQVIFFILLYNDIRNMELMLRQRINKNHDYGSLFSPALLSESELTQYLDMPRINQPDSFPEFFTDFLTLHHDDSQRLNAIEELYRSYYTDLVESSDSFLSFFAKTLYTIRTIISAYRLKKADKAIEENLIGEEETVSTIAANRNSADFGLKRIFPETAELLSILDKSELEREKDLDLFIIRTLQNYREDDLFGDHVIYLYILSLFFRDRWALYDEEEGKRIVKEILEGQQETTIHEH